MSYTIIATFRDDNQDGTRMNNLKHFLDYYGRLDKKIIIVQQDRKDKISNILKDHKNVHHVFVYNSGLFNKSWGYNVGIRVAKEYGYCGIYMFCDVDIMIPLKKIIETSLKFNDNKVVAAKPYLNIWHLNRQLTHDFYCKYDMNIIANIPPKERRGNVVYAGGCIFISDNCLKEINGWDEEYRGWGGEDNAMGTIIIRKYGKQRALVVDDGIAVHLWHSMPNGLKSKMGHEYYCNNKKRLLELFKMKINSFVDGRKEINIGDKNKYINENSDGYYIHAGYNHRLNITHHDDRKYTDRWQKETYNTALAIAEKNGYKNILDIGCGSGYKLVKWFPVDKYNTLGLELEPSLSFLKQTYPEHKWKLSGCDKPFNNDEFSADVVICSDVIEHFTNPDILLNFIKTIKFNYLVMSTPARDLFSEKMSNEMPINRCHCREWNIDEFRRYIDSYNFNVDRHFYTSIAGENSQIIAIKG